MTKTECLDLLKLLSAMESFLMAQEKRLPEYLHADLQKLVDLLEREILK